MLSLFLYYYKKWLSVSEIAALLVKVVLVGGYGEFVAGGLVAHNYCLGMHLEHGGCPLVGDVAVDDVLQGASLVMTIAYYQDFLGIHHSAYAYSKGLGGHLAQVAAEETAVGYDGVGGQGLDAGAGRERGS